MERMDGWYSENYIDDNRPYPNEVYFLKENEEKYCKGLNDTNVWMNFFLRGGTGSSGLFDPPAGPGSGLVSSEQRYYKSIERKIVIWWKSPQLTMGKLMFSHKDKSNFLWLKINGSC